MRYHKSIQIVATFVASAGAFVVLQGTAWADSAATAPAQQATLAPDGSAVSAPASKPSDPQSDTTGKGNGQSALQHSNGSNLTSGDTGSGPKAQPDDTAKVPGADDSKPQGAITNPPAKDGADITTLPAEVTTPTATPNSGGASTMQQPPAITFAVPSQPPSAMRPAIILPIQPTIRSYAVVDTGDLAWSLPSAPAAARQPVPAKTNGALGNLRLIMANVVVPTTYALTDWVGLAGLMALGALGGLLLGSLYSFSYGLWLKRGGFVNAARSDAPTALATSSLFATPQLLGYVTMPPRRHSPIFVVADIKFLIYEFLFPTLSERRTCI